MWSIPGNVMKYTRLLCLYLILQFCLAQLPGFGQDLESPELEIAACFRELGMIRSDAEKQKLGHRIDSTFRTILVEPRSFHYPFDSLLYVGKIYSPDHLIRIYSWNIPMMDGTQHYSCYIQKMQEGQLRFYELSHVRTMEPDTLSVYSNKKWYGALYYDILQKTCAGSTYYVVLGIDLHNYLTTRKVIDVIQFRDPEIIMGAPIFRKGASDLVRIIFEYSSQVSMMLRYLAEKDMIVFDHLSPHDPRYTGQYQYYGPDFTYDGFHFRECIWTFQEDLDLRNAF